MPEAIIPILRTFPLFTDAQEATLKALVPHCVFQSYSAGIEINRHGKPPRFVHCMRTGSVEAWSRINASETILLAVEAPVVFEVATAVRGSPSPVSLITREPTESLAIETAAFLRALREDAGLCYAALEHSSRSNLLLIDRLLDQKLRTAEQRLGQWILLQLSRSQDKTMIRLTYSKRALALELGMTPANLSRLFNVLRDHGVDVDGKTMAITDFEKLRALAEG